MKKRVISYLGSTLLFCSLGLPVKAESILAEIQRTGILKVAVREDAAPFGYLDLNDDLKGYCLDFFALLRKQLVRNLNRPALSVKLFKSTADNRFSLVRSDIVYLECGPNTIDSENIEDTSFSTAFFVTGTQFLINNKNRDRFKLDQNLENVRLGVIKNTTTEKFITEMYPSAIIYRFSGVTARNRGVQAVSQGKIDAMISDGILLRAEAQRQELSASRYPLIPNNPLTCDRYGMIISKDAEWKDFVDSVIDSEESSVLYRAWFGNSSNNQITSDSCSLQN